MHELPLALDDRRKGCTHLAAALEVVARPDDHVHRHAGSSEDLVRQPTPALLGRGVIPDDDQEVVITVRTGIAAGMGTE